MTLITSRSDEDLALAAARGDKDAFSGLYERHFRGVYDLVVRMVREHETAVDVAQNSFLNAWVNLQKRTVTGNIKAWLYTIARNNAISELRRGKRFVSLGEEMAEPRYPPAFARIDAERLADPESIIEDSELADLVWTSASALSPREYSLLDLHVRRGLGTEDLSQTLGVPKSTLYTQLSRLKDSLEESVTVNLLMRRGRKDCDELDALVSAAGAGLTRDFRQVVSRHLRTCERCQGSRRRYLAPAEIFAGLALVPLPVEASKPAWLAASAGAGVLGVVLTQVLTPARWLLGTLKDAAAPLKAAAAASAAVTVATPLLVGVVLITGGGDDAVEPLPASGAQPTRAARSPATSPSTAVLSAQATPEAPALTPTPTPVAVAIAPLVEPRPTIAATAAATPAVSPVATPTPSPAPPTPLPVQIEIGLGAPPKRIEADSSATVSLTIFGSEAFSTADVNLATVLLNGAPVERSDAKDVDGNGHPDLVLHFKISQASLPANAEVCIEGETFSGLRFVGCATIRPIPAGAQKP